jgi:hypothetical protein
LTFNQFKSGAFKAVQADDGAFAALLDSWDVHPESFGRREKRQKGGIQRSFLAKNPKVPFPFSRP